MLAVPSNLPPTMIDLEAGKPANEPAGYLEPLGKALSSKLGSGTALSKAFLSSGMPVTFKVGARHRRLRDERLWGSRHRRLT